MTASAPLSGDFTHTIDGRSETSTTVFEVLNPSIATPFAICPDASREQLDRAVAAARAAFAEWSRLGFAARRRFIHMFAARVSEHTEEIARIITSEQGRPLAQARREIDAAVRSLKGMADLEVSDQLIRDDGGRRITLQFRPMGVVGAITPWNVPVALAAHKIAQALIAGNTMVLKPSPYTPLSTLILGKLSRDIFPNGVFNVVAGGNDLGRWMTEHADIDRISFTGSVQTGKHVNVSASGTLKRVTLELGGNDPAIILDDADIDAVAPKIFAAAFANCGQICMAIKRVYVPDRHYDKVCDTLSELAKNFRVGDGFEPCVQMGPLQNKMQYDKVLDLLEDTKNRLDARILVGGHALNRRGYFIAPTIVADIGDDARLVREEQFGPILPVLRYSDIDDAVARANDTRLGLCASVWTSDFERGAAIANRIDAGTVWVNHHLSTEPDVPFGGFKESGTGREHGILGLQGYMEARVIYLPVESPEAGLAETK